MVLIVQMSHVPRSLFFLFLFILIGIIVFMYVWQLNIVSRKKATKSWRSRQPLKFRMCDDGVDDPKVYSLLCIWYDVATIHVEHPAIQQTQGMIWLYFVFYCLILARALLFDPEVTPVCYFKGYIHINIGPNSYFTSINHNIPYVIQIL